MTGNEFTIKEAIEELLKAYNLKGKLSETKLLQSWDRITGPMISKHTTNLFIEKKVLYIKLDSPALKNELSYAREKIMDMLNEEAGEEVISKVVFI